MKITVLYPLELQYKQNLEAVAIGRRNANQAIEIGRNMHFTNSRNLACVCDLEDCTGVSEEIDAEGQYNCTAMR